MSLSGPAHPQRKHIAGSIGFPVFEHFVHEKTFIYFFVPLHAHRRYGIALQSAQFITRDCQHLGREQRCGCDIYSEVLREL